MTTTDKQVAALREALGGEGQAATAIAVTRHFWQSAPEDIIAALCDLATIALAACQSTPEPVADAEIETAIVALSVAARREGQVESAERSEARANRQVQLRKLIARRIAEATPKPVAAPGDAAREAAIAAWQAQCEAWISAREQPCDLLQATQLFHDAHGLMHSAPPAPASDQALRELRAWLTGENQEHVSGVRWLPLGRPSWQQNDGTFIAQNTLRIVVTEIDRMLAAPAPSPSAPPAAVDAPGDEVLRKALSERPRNKRYVPWTNAMGLALQELISRALAKEPKP